ncbi:serine/threonine-protein kinase [Nocardioides sp.]|uniref:serine/threonine-protein kinase n=1 Tax=Nocardioides sp. TaxID=35761 RepID=UPI00286C7E13|nr:serine/threonine-protein kinase [Nocardioides sp.]
MEKFGAYEVVAVAGSGVLGSVYRARHTELGREAAIKELSAAVRGAPGQAARLRAEAHTLAALSHPNIVELYDYVEEPGRAWLAEQWVDGTTLEEILAEHGRLRAEQAVGVMRGALLGLAHAHEHGVLHRDISATNILVDRAGTSMLLDFGLAAPATTGVPDGSAGTETVVGTLAPTGSTAPMVLGTPAYLSPEAARGTALSTRSDVYSAAALLHHLLAGAPLFSGSSLDMVRQHLEAPAPHLTSEGAEMEQLLVDALSKDPSDRPADASALLHRLEQAAERRYGSGWLGRASIAGLVGGTGTALGMVTVLGSTGTGVRAAEQVLDTAVGGQVARQVASSAGRSTRKLAMTLGATAAAFVVVAVTTVVLTNGDGETAVSADISQVNDVSSREPEPSEPVEPPPDPVVTSVPDGRYRLVVTVSKTDNPGYGKVGQVAARVTWTLRPSCPDAASCSGAIKSSSGNRFDYAWNGSVLRVSAPEPRVEEGLCFDSETGEDVPGTHFKTTSTTSRIVLRAVGSAREGQVPRRFVGDAREHAVVSELRGDCTNSYADTGAPDPTVTLRYVATLQGTSTR